MENIFSILNKYKPQETMTPEENFFTESFKFILLSDSTLLDKFVRFISHEEKIKFHPPYEVESQVSYDNSRVDLQIIDAKGEKILIEIKLGAKENRYHGIDGLSDYGQVEKYCRLNRGYVCFISPKECEITVDKKFKSRYLGQYEWSEIYTLIDNYKLNNKIGKVEKHFINDFLKFMKEKNMSPFEGFSKKDIELSKRDITTFQDKLRSFLVKIYKDKEIQAFCKKHQLSAVGGTPKLLWGANRIILAMDEWDYNKKGINIVLAFFTPNEDDTEKEGLYYYQSVYTFPDAYRESYKNHFKEVKINARYFQKELDNTDVFNNEFYFAEFIKRGEKKVINYIYKSLVELEKSGVLEILKTK